ncbi:MAG: alpha/beta hydrolase [Candidatus Altiarchaeota archaeon]|nr:alpha/beta hydrolase [Candidatus Altiarchaeota archaeon]
MPIFEREGEPSISYYASGNLDDTTIIFLHGLTSGKGAWPESVNFFKEKGYGVIAPDLRGHGGSESKDGEYKLSDYSDDIKDLADYLGVKNPIIVGHSWSGSIGLSYANDNPVSGLVIFSPMYNFDNFPGRKYLEPLLNRFTKTPPLLTVSNMRKLSGIFSKESKVGKAHRIYGRSGLRGRSGTAELLKALRASNNVKYEQYAKDTPIGLIYGSEENGLIKEHIKHIQDNYDDVKTYEIPGGHHVQKEHPKKFNGALYDFIREIKYQS